MTSSPVLKRGIRSCSSASLQAQSSGSSVVASTSRRHSLQGRSPFTEQSSRAQPPHSSTAWVSPSMSFSSLSDADSSSDPDSSDSDSSESDTSRADVGVSGEAGRFNRGSFLALRPVPYHLPSGDMKSTLRINRCNACHVSAPGLSNLDRRSTNRSDDKWPPIMLKCVTVGCESLRIASHRRSMPWSSVKSWHRKLWFLMGFALPGLRWRVNRFRRGSFPHSDVSPCASSFLRCRRTKR